MSIPFLRKFPNGKAAVQHVERSLGVEHKALNFLVGGGWYTAEVTQAGKIKLAATDANLVELAVCETTNSPEMGEAIDKLVEISQQFVNVNSITKH
jgi:hypothetical protein